LLVETKRCDPIFSFSNKRNEGRYVEGDEGKSEDATEGEDAGGNTRSNAEFDGLYFSMSVDPTALMAADGAASSATAALGITAAEAIESANHFVAQGGGLCAAVACSIVHGP
jgi:hypothetical protein